MDAPTRAYNEKRERLLSAIEFGTPDRMPVRGGCFSLAAVEEITGRTDYHEHPKEVYAEANRIWDVDTIHQFVLPERLDRQYGPNGELDTSPLRTCMYGLLANWEAEHGTVTSPEDFRDFVHTLPEPRKARDTVDQDLIYRRWVELDRWGDFLYPMVWTPGHLAGTVSWMWYSRIGYETYLMFHQLYQEEAAQFFAFLGEEGRAKNEAIARAMHDHHMFPLIYSGEDICANVGPLIRPSILHNTYFPALKRAVEPVVDAGIHWLWHSDGNILPIVPDILDCGIDGFQGFEEDKEMRLEGLLYERCRNGSYPFICGSVSVTSTMYESPEAVRAEKQRMQRIFDERGGVILAASSSIMPNTPVENIMELYRRDDRS